MPHRSPFTLEHPPPRRAPVGCPLVIGWELAAYMWRRHLPDALTAIRSCAACRLPMPCPCWRFADGFLAAAVEPSAESTRELPRVQKPPLPRREPGALLKREERFDGWFTQ